MLDTKLIVMSAEGTTGCGVEALSDANPRVVVSAAHINSI
jgi:hypothetical protein